jgi:hypothetical protein
MRRTLRFVGLTVVVLLMGAPWAAAQKTKQIFLRVAGANGAPVTDLKATEVKVLEDDMPCKILKVEPAGPIKLQVLVDNGPVNTDPITSLREGLQQFFEKLPEGVEASLYTTAPQGRAIVKNTPDRKKLIDGIAVITPDRGTGAFFESLLDAVDRVDHDKAPGIPTIVVIGSNAGLERISDRDIPDIQEKIIKDGIRVDVVISMGGTNTSSTSGTQLEIGTALARLSGGHFENINSTTRLATLIPEFGQLIALNATAQQNQYRVTYEPQGKRNSSVKVGVSVSRDGTTVTTSRDGR